MSTWLNSDGLYIRYGQGEVTPTKVGQFASVEDGGSHVIEAQVTLADLTTTAAIVGEGIYVPKDYVLARVEVIADTAATSGGAATLDIGFVRNTDRSTAVDDDGAVAALPLASINVAGETTVLRAGETYAGALVGTVVSDTYVSLIAASYNAAAFTAGVVTVRLVLRRI